MNEKPTREKCALHDFFAETIDKKLSQLCEGQGQCKKQVHGDFEVINKKLDQRVTMKIFMWVIGFLVAGILAVGAMGVESKMDRAITRAKLNDLQLHQYEEFKTIKQLIKKRNGDG